MHRKNLRIAFGTTLALFAIAVAILAPGVLADVHHSIGFFIIGHQPTAHHVGVALDANIQATFSEDANAGTITNDTFVVHGHLGGLVTGTFTYDGATFTTTLDPARAFHTGEVLRVSATDGIFSDIGLPLQPYGWQFTAGPLTSRSVAGFIDIGAALTGTYVSGAAWGDYDNDGDLDILLTGWTGSARVSKVYRNDGAASGFTDIGAALTAMKDGSVAWGDYDNDGDLDILLTGGISGSPYVLSSIYRNDGGASGFTDIAAGLAGLRYGSAAWGDYDNDGDLDIVLSGAGDPGAISKVYRNDGLDTFTEISAGLTAAYNSSVAWGDYDNDGDLDILLAGYATGTPISKVYRNDGPSGFADIGAALTGVDHCSVAWGDYDNDSDLDILLTGSTGTPPYISKVYRNDAEGSGFTDIGAGLTGVYQSSVAWGDYDNDGDLDILLTGYPPAGGRIAKVYRNDGGPSGFSDIGAGLPGVSSSSVAWGDYDNDGDLDILLTGHDGSDAVSKVYRNNSKPDLGSVAPASGSGPTGVTTAFTTTWTDPDGWQDLKQCYFHIGDSPSLAGNVTLMYNAAKNKLWMRTDDGTAWFGGYAPGSANTMENGQAIVDCSLTTKHGDGDALSVTWAIEFKPGYTGAKKLGLKCKDRSKARAKGKWKGTIVE
jgi:hypothetical protein